MGCAPTSLRLSLIRRIEVPRLGGPERALPHPLGTENTVGLPPRDSLGCLWAGSLSRYSRSGVTRG